MPLSNECHKNEAFASDRNRLFGVNTLVDTEFTIDSLRSLTDPPSHSTEASSSLFISSTISLLSHILSTIFGAFSFVLSSLSSILLPTAAQLQRAGETLLATFLLLSVIQALVALYQYRYDSRGQLVFPDGLTYGEEDYYTSNDDRMSGNDVTLKKGDDEKSEHAAIPPPSMSTTSSSNAATDDNMRQILSKFNKSLVLLLPWMTQNMHNLLTKNTHLFHIGFIVFILDSLLPLLDGNIDTEISDNGMQVHEKSTKFAAHYNNETSISPLISNGLARKVFSRSSKERTPLRILVIGDSLAIGTGCVDRFDVEKTNAIPMALIENIAPKSQSSVETDQSTQGPVFPRVLARTLSLRTHRPVQWRSAGVDGGSVSDVQAFCMDVVKQEHAKGIDVIVVLFGMNDLKKHLSVNPFQNILRTREEKQGGKGVARFRHEMDSIISEIHARAPDALIVFPALPIQPFHKNSIINIFPLGLMVDTSMGLWERQKKIASISRDNVLYVDLKAKEIADWYTPSNAKNNVGCISVNGLDEDFRGSNVYNDVKEEVLLSGDGVHPNRAMYAKWAELVGHKLYRCIQTKWGGEFEQIAVLEQNQLENNVPAKNTEPNHLR